MLRRRRAYSEEFKKLAVAKMLSRGSRSTGSVMEELGLGSSTIYKWMGIYSPEDHIMSRKPVSPQSLSAQEKFKLVFEFEKLPEVRRGEFLRAAGVTEDQLSQWKSMMTEGLGGNNSSESELKGQVKRLEKELNRKEKALAEAAALLVLQKKIQSYYGSGDE